MALLEFAKELGLAPKRVSSTGGGEYHSSCPSCNGDDRFVIQPNFQQKNCQGRYFCRQCLIRGDAIEFARKFFNLSFQKAVSRAGGHVDSGSSLFGRSPIKPAIKPPPKLWQEKASALIEWTHAELLKESNVVDWLTKRGLDRKTIRDCKLGFCPDELFLSRQDWGLEVVWKEKGEEQKLWIPRGVVIPIQDRDGSIIRLKVRRSDWSKKDELPKYICVSGSMGGLSIVGDVNKGLMVVVESELDAFAIHHACADFLFCIAIGSNSRDPDNVTDYHAKLKKLVVIPDNDEGGEVMRKKWTRLYAHARSLPTPIGKDVGEAIELGLNVREWLKKELACDC